MDVEYLPEGAGRCVKQHVQATVVGTDGMRYTSTNFCMSPQKQCPRADMPTGVGYDLCKSICQQYAHAEVNAIRAAGASARGATLYLDGHYYACDSCKSAASEAGVSKIVIVKKN